MKINNSADEEYLEESEVKKDLLNSLFLSDRLSDGVGEISSDFLISELVNEFTKYHWFIGLSKMGSRLRGYNAQGSDLDLKIFYNRSEISNIELADIIKVQLDNLKKRFRNGVCKVTVPYFVRIDFLKIKKGLQEIYSPDDLEALLTIKDLSGPTVGEKVQKTRQKIKDILSVLSEENKKIILGKVVDLAITEERMSEQKMMIRLNMNSSDMTEFWQARQRLWQEHIYSLWL